MPSVMKRITLLHAEVLGEEAKMLEDVSKAASKFVAPSGMMFAWAQAFMVALASSVMARSVRLYGMAPPL